MKRLLTIALCLLLVVGSCISTLLFNVNAVGAGSSLLNTTDENAVVIGDDVDLDMDDNKPDDPDEPEDPENPSPVELIDNGDFSKPTNFSSGGIDNRIPAKSTDGFFTWFRATLGNNVAYNAIVDDGTGNMVGKIAHNLYQGVEIESNKSYRFTFRVKSPDITGLRFSITNSGNTDADDPIATILYYLIGNNTTKNNVNATNVTVPVTNNWVTYTIFFSVGRLNPSLNYAIRLIGSPYDASNPKYYYIDDVSMIEYIPDDTQVKATVSAENGTAYISNSELVDKGTVINVTSDGNPGYVFDGWYENGQKVCSTVNYTFEIQSNRTLVAKFVPDPNLVYDVDGDLFINDNDAVAIRNHILGKTQLTGNALAKADVNKDGKVSVTDIVMLRKYFDGSTPQNLEGAQLKSAVLAGTYEKFLKDSIDNEGNMVRIANAMRKAKSGQAITIGFIGGSITAGATAGAESNRYVNLVKDWWVRNFPQSQISFINAGIGSTTSMLGVHRVEDHLFNKVPAGSELDFVVVDFTTNDDRGNNLYRIPYENLLRRILEYPTQPGVLAIYFGSINSQADFNNGIYNRVPNSESAHKPSCLFYDIPIINYQDALWKYIDANVISWPEVAADYIHPNTNGHRMAAACINYYLSNVLANLDTIGTQAPELPVEFFWGSDIYMNAKILDNSKIQPDSSTNFSVVRFQNRWDSWRSTANSGEITFTIRNCKAFTLMQEYTLDGGTADVFINGEKYITFSSKHATATSLNWMAFNPYVVENAQDLIVNIKTKNGPVTITSILYTDGTHPVPGSSAKTTDLKSISNDIKLNGRTSWNGNNLQLDWVGSGFELNGNFNGQIKLDVNYTGSKILTYAIIDDDFDHPIQNIFDKGNGQYVIANLTGKHKLQFFKATEPASGTLDVKSITYTGVIYQKPKEKALSIEFLGDSITSAGGLYKATQQPDSYLRQDGLKSFATLTANKLNADLSIISRSGIAATVGNTTMYDIFPNTNYRETNTKWDFANNQVDIVVIGLGTNDTPTYLSGNQDVLKQGVKNLLALVRSKYPNAKIIWVYGMMDTRIPNVYQSAIAEMNDPNMYFKMLTRNADGEGGHPTPEGHITAANELTAFIKSIL